MNSDLKGTSRKKLKNKSRNRLLRVFLIYRKSHLVRPSEFHGATIPLSFNKENYGFPSFRSFIARTQLFDTWKVVAAYQRLCSRGNNEGLGEPSPKRFPALSSTLERFTRSIASRGGKGLKWIKCPGRTLLKLANACGYDRAIFFHPRCYPGPFLLTRFVRPVEMASSVENCSFILQPASRSDGDDRRARRIRRHAANELVKWSGFSPREPDVTPQTARSTLFSNLCPPIFSVNNAARGWISGKTMKYVWYYGGGGKNARMRDGGIRDMQARK